MKHTLLLIVAAIALTGCVVENGDTATSLDGCKRAEVFKQCLAAVPAGPVVVGADNPWDKVITACENAAYYQSRRLTKTIPMECRS